MSDLERVSCKARDGTVVGQRSTVGGQDRPPGPLHKSQAFPLAPRKSVIEGSVQDLENEETSEDDGKTCHDKDDCYGCPSLHREDPKDDARSVARE